MGKELPASKVLPQVPVSCFTCDNRQDSEWCALKNDELDLLDSVKAANVYQPGQVVFYQGNPCLGIFCVEEGTVALRKTDANGNNVITRLVQAGETLGYRAFFADGPYAASAEAVTAARVCFIDRDAVGNLLARNPTIGQQFLRHMARDLEESDSEQLNLATLDVRTRLSHLLLSLKDRFSEVDEEGNIVLQLPISRQDMASMLGTRPETVARTIKGLESDGVAQFNGRTVTVNDLDLLLDEVEPAML
ncbi:MAG: Crp/Fnr family transcriptional regulator [Myxococcota bacterium]